MLQAEPLGRVFGRALTRTMLHQYNHVKGYSFQEPEWELMTTYWNIQTQEPQLTLDEDQPLEVANTTICFQFDTAYEKSCLAMLEPKL